MSRIFISYSSVERAEALAVQSWLENNGWENDVFVDVDPEHGLTGGEAWRGALRDAAGRCEAIILLVSRAWLASKPCWNEFLLAEKYGKPPLWPSTVEGHGACYQWSLWSMTEVETPMLDVVYHRMMLPADQRDEKVAVAALERLKAPLKVLDDHLQKSDYLLGKEFTIADLNVASVLSIARYVQLDLSPTPTAQKWLQKCLERPANQRVSAMK